jgi:peptide subunit release factor RF-3
MEGKIYAVHDRDLKGFLSELNLLDKIEAGELKCPHCDCTITIKNIGFISKSKGKFEICCDNISCFYKRKTETQKSKVAQQPSEKVEQNEKQPREFENKLEEEG